MLHQISKKTNQSSKTLFPIILDVDHPEFFELLDKCAEANDQLIKLEKENEVEIMKLAKKVPHYFSLTFSLLRLYFLPAIDTKYIWTEKIA